jgi:hypothetical protein
MGSPLKAALEDLLRERKLARELPPLRGERRLLPLATGSAELDQRLGGGFPRGRLSEAFGPASSGRTGLALATLARVTGGGALAALVDPMDGFDPASAVAAGTDLARLLWLRGERRSLRALADATAVTVTLLGSGLFELVVLDLAGVSARELRRLPATTWIRLQRTVEETTAVLLLLAGEHVARGPGGVSLALRPAGARWSGAGPGRLLDGLAAEARTGALAHAGVRLALQAFR